MVEYKRKKVDLSEERRILTHMIISTEFLRQVQGIAEPVLFESPYVRQISSWVWEYYDRIGSAPGRDIEDLYRKKKNTIRDEEETELIAEFLNGLSDDVVPLTNIDYAVISATEYFRIRNLCIHRDKILTAIEQKNPGAGEHEIATFKKVETDRSSGIDLLKDAATIIQAYENRDEQLFSFPGALGEHIGVFNRGDFVSFLGRPKVGKTWSLLYTAHRSVLMGYRTMYFSLEMVKNSIVRRAWQSFRGIPRASKKVSLPYFTRENEEDKWSIDYREEIREGAESELTKISELQKGYRQQIMGTFQIFPMQTNTTTFSDIKNIIDNCIYYDNFVPDVIVIDYADIMKMEVKGETRNQLDDLWKKLRGLAQELNCLVVTASQVNRSGNKGDVTLSHVAEDFRKGGHVTHMIALNKEPEEEEKGIMRWSKILDREGPFFRDQVVVLYSYEIGRAYLDSRKRSEVAG